MPFTAYWILLTISGVLMVAMAATGYGQRTAGRRVLNGIIGLAFAAYGLYLGLIFTTGHYYVFLYAFLVPILLVVDAVRNANARRAATAQQTTPVA